MVTVNVLEDAPRSKCHLLLYRNVENAADLRKMIMAGQVEASLIKPEMVVSTFQVLVAANKAVRSLEAKKMTTRSVFSEIIFNLSPTKNISESLLRFGLGDSDTDILAVVVDPDVDSKVEKLSGQVQGQLVPLDELPSLTNVPKVTEMYKITKEELAVSSLSDGVISRMACKEFYSK